MAEIQVIGGKYLIDNTLIITEVGPPDGDGNSLVEGNIFFHLSDTL